MADDAGGPSGDAPSGADTPPDVDASPGASAPSDTDSPSATDASALSSADADSPMHGTVPPSGDDGDSSDSPTETGPVEGAGGREVVVPERLYRVVTVFSTLLAVLSFVLGFTVLDAATTLLSNPTGSVVVRLLAALGVPAATLQANSGTLALVVALVGLALVVGSAAFYAYGTRFRAPGMGKPKDDSDEDSDDG